MQESEPATAVPTHSWHSEVISGQYMWLWLQLHLVLPTGALFNLSEFYSHESCFSFSEVDHNVEGLG